jgi:hypothetical protein
MSDTPNDDQSGFVAEQPEHCFACFRLIHPGQTNYLTIEQEVLCADCALDAPSMPPSSRGVIRVREDLAVEVKGDRLLMRRGNAEVEVFPGEIRRFVNALATE